MRGVFAIPEFRRIFAAMSATMTADSLLLLTFGIWVKTLTGSSAAAGSTILMVVAPSLMAPVFGWLVDRVPSRRFLMYGYPVAAMTLLPLIAVRGAADVWIIYLVALAYGIALVAFPPAVTGLLKLAVPHDLLVHANASLSTFRESLRLFGPLAGAGLYAWAGIGPVVAIVLIAYAIAWLAVSGLRMPGDLAAEGNGGIWREMVAGIRHLRLDPWLWRPVLAMTLAFGAFGSLESVIYAITDHFGVPATFVGVMVSVQGIGAVVGGLLSGRLVERFGHVPIILLSLGLFVASLLVFVVAPALPVAIAAMVPLGFGVPLLVVSANTMLQTRTPQSLIGRVQAAAGGAIGIAQVGGIAIGAALVGVVDFRIMLGACAAVIALCLAWLGAWFRAAGPMPQTVPERVGEGLTG